MERIIVKDIIKTDLAVTSNKASYLKTIFEEKISKREEFIIDFSNIKNMTTAFLNIAIGELYKVGTPEELNKYIKIDTSTLTTVQYQKVKLVMENSKRKISQEMIDEVSLDD